MHQWSNDVLQIDSDKIIPYLEDKFPEPALGKPDDLPQMWALVSVAQRICLQLRLFRGISEQRKLF